AGRFVARDGSSNCASMSAAVRLLPRDVGQQHPSLLLDPPRDVDVQVQCYRFLAGCSYRHADLLRGRIDTLREFTQKPQLVPLFGGKGREGSVLRSTLDCSACDTSERQGALGNVVDVRARFGGEPIEQQVQLREPTAE